MTITKTSEKSSAVLFILIASLLFFPTIETKAQNVGIGTTNPQVTLDVKGNQRTGGNSHFISFDSTSGRFSWSNSNLWVPNSQYLMMHSASSEGLYYGNSQIEYRNSSGNPAFFTNWSNGFGYFRNRLGIGRTNPDFPLSFSDSLGEKVSFYGDSLYHYGIGIQPFLLQFYSASGTDMAFGQGSSSSFVERMRIKGNGNVGIGTSSPTSLLHIGQGSAGGNSPYGPLSVEASAAAYIGLLTPDVFESGIIFGNNSDNASGGIIYNNSQNSYGLILRTYGNADRVAITSTGNVGIGMNNPTATIDVYRGTAAGGTAQFRGTQNVSHFNFGSSEDTYVRGGKNGAHVILNDLPNSGNVGIGVSIPLAKLHVAENSVLFSSAGDVTGSPGDPPIIGMGRRLMWYADKAAFRAGFVYAGQWDKDSIGSYSFATGNQTTASGYISTAIGYKTRASGGYSTAMGAVTVASGEISTSMGLLTVAKAAASTSIGWSNDISDNPNPIIPDPLDRIFQIGNGSSETQRSNALTVLRNGKVGIGTITPGEKLHVIGNIIVSGNICGASFSTCSDIRYKKSLSPINNSLFSVLSLNAIYYYWKKDEFPAMHFNDKRQLGFSAQEVEKLFPEIVMTDANGYKSVDYGRLTPVLVEAIKEQQQQINAQQQQIDELKKDKLQIQEQVNELKKMMEKLLSK